MRRKITTFLVVVVFGSSGVAWAEGYQAAAGSVVITPQAGAFLAGYGADRRATGRLDDLFVKVAVVRAGTEQLVLMTIDCIGLTRPDINRIRQRLGSAMADTHVVISSTHTHAGPDVVGIWGPAFWRSGRDEQYIDGLIDQAAALAIEVAGRLQPVSSRVAGTEWRADWVVNRSEPQLLDARLAVLQFVDEAGASVLTLTNFACHPTVLDGANTLLSADYPAGFYAAMARELPGEHLFLQGAIGGWVQPVGGDATHLRAVDLGASVAAQALQLLAGAERNPYAPMQFRETTVDVPLENWGFKLLMWLGVLDRPTFDGHMRTSVAAFHLGGARFATHPGETSPAYSLATRDLLGGPHTFVLGLTQDAMGYILKPEFFANDAAYPHADYLTSVSVGPEAGPRVMAALRTLLIADSGD